MHTCDNKVCCNPSHLRLGTQTENVADMVQKGRGAKGEKHGFSRLTSKEVLQIRKMHFSGLSIPKLAGKFGVSVSAISSIVTGRAWKHVGGPVESHSGKRKAR